MCEACNTRKLNYPDQYWGQRFYFDGDLHLERARVSQREYIYTRISHMAMSFFSAPATFAL